MARIEMPEIIIYGKVPRERLKPSDIVWLDYLQGGFCGTKSYRPPFGRNTPTIRPPYRPPTPVIRDIRPPVPYDPTKIPTWTLARNPLTYKPPIYTERPFKFTSLFNPRSSVIRFGSKIIGGVAAVGPALVVPLIAAHGAYIKEMERKEDRQYTRRFGSVETPSLLRGAKTIEQGSPKKSPWIKTIIRFIRGE